MSTTRLVSARPSSDAPCPCGSGQSFGQCCEPLLDNRHPAADAEKLMRSRFTAHALRDFRYLHRTYVESSRRPYKEEHDAGGMNWTRLVIHSHEPGPQPDRAFVDFTAYFEQDGAEHALHEKSEFARIDGTWFYTRSVRTGPAPVKHAHAKVGRNDPCPCGSGKKYKHCCGK